VSEHAWSRDWRVLAVPGDEEGSIELWDTRTGQLIRTLKGLAAEAGGAGVSALAFSPDGKTLASGTFGGNIVLYDTSGGAAIRTLPCCDRGVFGLAFSADGQRLAAFGRYGGITIWDTGTGGEVATLDSDSEADAVSCCGKVMAFGPGDRFFASVTSSGIAIWDLVDHRLVKTLGPDNRADHWKGIAFSWDGRHLAGWNADGVVGLWDLQVQSRILETLKSKADVAWPIWSLAFDPAGPLLAAGAYNGPSEIWDVARGEAAQQLTADGLVSSLAFSGDGALLAYAADDGNIVLWDVTAGRQAGLVSANDSTVAWSPDGRTIAGTGFQAGIKLWDTGDHNEIADLSPGASAQSLAFSPDGRSLASAGETEITVWDVESRQARLTLPAVAFSLAFSPDGTRLASGDDDRAIALWDTRTGERSPATLVGHPAIVGGLAFAPDGQTLASASDDGTVMLWDLNSNLPIGTLIGRDWWTLPGQIVPGAAVAFSADGRTLASSAGLGNEIRLWNVSLDSWKQIACQIVGRQLTMDEWTRYLAAEGYRETCPGT
jgi:WD40 repeat protein